MVQKREVRDEKIIALVTLKQKRILVEEALKRGVSLAQIVRERLFPQTATMTTR